MPSERVLLLTPSSGLGGGIERFTDAVQDAFNHRGIRSTRIDLVSRGTVLGRAARHRTMLAAATSAIGQTDEPVRIVLMHRSLLPTGVMIKHQNKQIQGLSCVLHGIDIWGGRPKPELQLLRLPFVRPVAVSAYSAGVLGPQAAAAILHPTISSQWYGQLREAAARARSRAQHPHLAVSTVFRLSQWRDKGLPTLVEACQLLGVDHRITVCGSGDIPNDLAQLVESVPSVLLRANLTDADLAHQLASSDVVTLATRLRTGRRPSGEGFGLALAEGQLAGAATIAPAFGGGHDTFIEGVTGHSPVDESPSALARTLTALLDPAYRDKIASAGEAIADAYFDPEAQRDRIVSRLL